MRLRVRESPVPDSGLVWDLVWMLEKTTRGKRPMETQDYHEWEIMPHPLPSWSSVRAGPEHLTTYHGSPSGMG
jgi:hypothetical protein